MPKHVKPPTRSGPIDGPPSLPSSKALVFISHDTRDAGFAEAFSTLLSNVTCGMLKSFRSSDKSGKQGLEYGSEWYPEIMKNLEQSSDVVCLLTQNSLDRPWILYEAGVAKGKLETPVHGVALGVPLSKASSGPFAQFQNCDGSDAQSVAKLVIQLAKRLPNADPQKDIVDSQVAEFAKKSADLLTATATTQPQLAQKKTDDSSAAKLFEEIKVMFQDLPSRMEHRISNAVRPSRRRKWRHFHPRMLDEMMLMSGLKEGDPIGILMMASLVREEMPWFYEIAREIYNTLKTGDTDHVEHELRRLRHMVEMMMHGPFMEDIDDKETHMMMMMEFPQMFDHIVHRYMERVRKPVPRKRPKPDADS